MLKSTAALALLLLATACAGPQKAARGGAKGGGETVDVNEWIDEIWLRLLDQRGLKLERRASVQELAAEPFKQAVRAHLATRIDAAELARDFAFYVALGLSEPGDDLRAQLDALISDQAAGFYDPDAQTLFVRQGASATELRAVLAHELEHALQDQLFGLPKRGDAKDADDKLGLHALAEGDATLAMLADAVATQRMNKQEAPELGVAAERMRQYMSQQPATVLLSMARQSEAAALAPLIVREALMFPYSAGFDLTVTLHRTGGFALIDKAFAKPPETSEQVLHPEKYLAGERAVSIAAPVAPPGTTLIAIDTMGELGLRSVLQQCVPLPGARVAAAGWGGDRLIVAETPDQQLVLGGSIVMDSESDALELETALGSLGECWAKTDRAPQQGKRWISNDWFVYRNGRDVAFSRGLALSDARGFMEALLRLERKAEPAAPSLNVSQVAAPPVLPETQAKQRGNIKGTTYSHPYLGLQATIPTTLSANLALPNAELLVRGGSGNSAVAVFMSSPSKWDERIRDDFFRGVTSSFGAQMGAQVKLVERSRGKATLYGVEGEQRVYGVERTKVRVRVLALPACDGRIMNTFVASSAADNDAAELDKFLESFQAIISPAPVCASLPAQ